ncbi:MAG: methyltransferase domain-containing protein [Thermoplasmata archaeon]
MADVGCGCGRALVNLAKAFPRSLFVGYDIFEPNLRYAMELARAEGVADRVKSRRGCLKTTTSLRPLTSFMTRSTREVSCAAYGRG